jgi:hypothetical protein
MDDVNKSGVRYNHTTTESADEIAHTIKVRIG